MYILPSDKSVRVTGRWYTKDEKRYVTTANGSYIEIAATGSHIILHFDMNVSFEPLPHVWISVDGGAMIEATLDRYMRINTCSDGEHIIKIICKGSMEMQPRWFSPLVGKYAFTGYEADGAGVLAPDCRKTIEFVGDSITEGVLVNPECSPNKTYDQMNRPYEDDSYATYAFLLAEKLNLRPYFDAYGAVGLTRGGCGGVPDAVSIYPYNFAVSEVEYPHPDFIMINHGANDRMNGAEKYISQYRRLLDLIRATHPETKIIAVSAFVGAFHAELGEFIAEYNKEHECGVVFVDTDGWLPKEPLHPGREGHKTAANRLYETLKDILI